MVQYRVLLHFDEYHKADLVLMNAKNILLDMGESNVEVMVVVNYEAVLMLIKTPNHRAGTIQELVQKGIRFTACSNAMRAFGVETLLDGVEVCPAAMGEIVRRQAEGFFYIRP